MDVGLNKPLKDAVKDCYDSWYMDAEYQAKPTGSDVARWATDSWHNAITPRMILNSWRKLHL